MAEVGTGSKFNFATSGTGKQVPVKDTSLPTGSRQVYFEIGDLQSYIGTRATTVAATAVASHVAQSNPHAQYLLIQNIVDNLTSSFTEDALSANQGRVLKGLVDTMQTNLDSINLMLSSAADIDNVVNKVAEVLAIFTSYPEGLDLYNELQNRYTKTEADTKFLTAIKTGGAYYQQNKILLQNGVDIVKIPQLNRNYIFEDSGATSVAMNLAWATTNNLHTEDIFIFENRRTTGDVTITADGSQVYFYIDGVDQVITLKPKQAAMLYRWSTTAYLGYSVFLNKEASTGGGGGIPEPNTDGNNVRTKSGSTLSWSQTELVSSTEKITWNGKQDKPVDQNMPTTGTISLDFNTETFDNITQTGSITFAGTNTTGSKKIVKTLIIQGSGNSAHTFTLPVGWINISGVLPDYSKQNYIEITYLDGTVFFCVNKYSAVSTTTPTLVTATILQDFLNVIELKYDRLLDGSVALQNSWWSFIGKTITGTQIVNNTVRITVSVAFATTDTAILSFTNIAGTADGLQDAVGNKCPNFALQNVVLVRYAYDDFNRADSTTSVGTASDGTAWQVINGTWGISGNKMYAASAAGSGSPTIPIIVKETSRLDSSVSLDVTWGATTGVSSVYIIMRYVDVNNYYSLGFVRNSSKVVSAVVYKYINGVLTQLGTINIVNTFADGTTQRYTYRVRGHQIQLIYSNTYYQNITDISIANATATKVGVRIFDGAASSGNTDRIDNFNVSE